MARISLDPPATLRYRVLSWYSRRHYGKILAPGRAVAHHRGVTLGYLTLESFVARWHRLPAELAFLAVFGTASAVGCEWCLDFGYWEGTTKGIDPAKIRAIATWPDSDAYTDLERRVIAFAQAASSTPPAVTDDQVAELRRDLDDAQLVELAMLVGVENLRSRFNLALGLTSQGFKDSCELTPN